MELFKLDSFLTPRCLVGLLNDPLHLVQVRGNRYILPILVHAGDVQFLVFGKDLWRQSVNGLKKNENIHSMTD